ncbi:MAG TPA: 30S ribosome-binding factor RbfA [Anaerolineae bacterium]|nr:30S ribosome-binding factor RbfA [Anaerolineae bacterium]
MNAPITYHVSRSPALHPPPAFGGGALGGVQVSRFTAMTAYRAERVAEQLQHLIGELLERRIKDPRLARVSVTSVKVSHSLREATVYVSALDGAAVKAEVLDGLERAAGYLRREVGQRLQLRSVPELFFKWDTSLETGEHVLRLLDNLKEE